MAGTPDENNGGKRGAWLTEEVVKQLRDLWSISGVDTLTDDEICERMGITPKQLAWALRTRTLWEVDEDTKDTLRGIRTRARGRTKSWYLQEIIQSGVDARKASKDAVKAKDYRGAASLMREWRAAFAWLAERQFPKSFNPARIETGDANKSAGELAAEVNAMLLAMGESVPRTQAEP